MGSTDSKIVTLPTVETPLVPIRECVSDFGEDELEKAVEPSVTGEVKFTLRERSSGRDQITAVHTDGEMRESYPFTVTDHDRGLCAYNRHSDGETAPLHIRRALIDFGYHDTAGPPESPLWFPEYARTIIPMLNGCMQSTDSELVRGLLRAYLVLLKGSLQAAYSVSRFESPAAVPDELVDRVFASGEDSPLYGAESWDAVDPYAMQQELSVVDWEFDGSFLPQPPRSTSEEWGSYLYDDDGDRDPDEIERALAENLAESPVIPFITDPSEVTEGDSAGLNPQEGAELRVEKPDAPEVGDYIRIIQYGPDGVAQHEFRITTPPGENQRGACVFESREPDAALPPYSAIHAVSTTGYTIENAPTFRLDATPMEIVKNSYDVARAVFTTPPVNETLTHQLDMVSQPLVLLWYALTAVDVAGAGSVDAVTTAFTQEAVDQSVSSVLRNCEADTKRLIIKFLRENHPDADAIEGAYDNSWISDKLHLDRTDLLAEVPDRSHYPFGTEP